MNHTFLLAAVKTRKFKPMSQYQRQILLHCEEAENALLMYFIAFLTAPRQLKYHGVSLGASKGIFGGQKIFFW